ncbi:hypothetical protein NOCARDAX2BIS_140138 [Nocardioides sp. AX2bis]|nr:hypothetical protein NOCARDAX2BIS_140138 [Nocardioides sp. AX2bis]
MSQRVRGVERDGEGVEHLGRARAETEHLRVVHRDDPFVATGLGGGQGGEPLEQPVDAADGLQALGHHQHHVGLGRDEALVVDRLHAGPADLLGDVVTPGRGDQRVRPGALAEHVVDAGLAAHVEEHGAQLAGDVVGHHLGDRLGHVGGLLLDAGSQLATRTRHPQGGRDLHGQRGEVLQVALGVDDHHRDAGVLELEHDVEGAQRGVGEDHGRLQRQDRLRIEVVAVPGDQGPVLDPGERGGDVPPDDLVAEAELEDGLRQGAVDVEGQDPVGVAHRHSLAAGVGHGDRQPGGRVRGHRVDDRVGEVDVDHALERAGIGGRLDRGHRRNREPGRQFLLGLRPAEHGSAGGDQHSGDGDQDRQGRPARLEMGHKCLRLRLAAGSNIGNSGEANLT